MAPTIKYFITGPSREEAFKRSNVVEDLEGILLTKFMSVDDLEVGKNIENVKFLKHSVEAKGEAEDWKLLMKKLKYPDDLVKYDLIVSIGSTTTQAWTQKRKYDDSELKDVETSSDIMKYLPGGLKLGAKNKETTQDIVMKFFKPLLDDDVNFFKPGEEKTKEVLLVNAYGYTLQEDEVQSLSTAFDENTKFDLGREENSPKRKIASGIKEVFADNNGWKINFSVWPRGKKYEENKISGSWAQGMSSLNKDDIIVDIGGGATHVYKGGKQIDNWFNSQKKNDEKELYPKDNSVKGGLQAAFKEGDEFINTFKVLLKKLKTLPAALDVLNVIRIKARGENAKNVHQLRHAKGQKRISKILLGGRKTRRKKKTKRKRKRKTKGKRRKRRKSRRKK